jgi:hypothetical protein
LFFAGHQEFREEIDRINRLDSRAIRPDCVSVGSSIVEMARSVREEPKEERHLRMEKARGFLHGYSTMVLV